VKTHKDALERTTLLLNRELFGGRADEQAIADALLRTTVRLAADRESLASRAGQSALVTAFLLVARLGIGIELVAPNVRLLDPVAPLRLPHLVDALCDLGADFRVDLERGADAARVGELPFGGFAGGAAIAAIALEPLVSRIESATGLTARSPRPSPGPPMRIYLEDLFPRLAAAVSTDLGEVDAISGGAITHALLFCM
jgi:hypothetical protein